VHGVGPQTIAGQESQQKLPYEMPVLNIYRDMGDRLVLDPPIPGLQDIAWKDADAEASQ